MARITVLALLAALTTLSVLVVQGRSFSPALFFGRTCSFGSGSGSFNVPAS